MWQEREEKGGTSTKIASAKRMRKAFYRKYTKA